MRISAGQLKGRTVATGKVFSRRSRGELRPTGAKVREAVFDILRNDLPDASFLDLYAGTGAVGMEALSRGAASTCFVEASRSLSSAISDFAIKSGLGNRIYVYTERVETFLRKASKTGMKFDIIFADPPYASDELAAVLPILGGSDILKENGCLIIEHSSKTNLPAVVPQLRLIKKYRYGDTMLTLYRKGPAPDNA